MAPTFDEDNGPGRLRSLWNAGEDLATAAADQARLEADLAAAQRDYYAALAARSALLGAVAQMQASYAAAHGKAVEAGWSSAELSDAGLPAPAARHSGTHEAVRPPAAPPVSLPVAEPATPQPDSPPRATPPPATPAPSPRSTWETEQTANLVTSRSTDNPVWYDSMRYSRISPPTATFDVADLESGQWTGLPTPSGPADEPDAGSKDPA